MSDRIEEYKEAMDRLPLRDSFEEETIQLLEDAAKLKKREKVIRFKQWGRIAATLVMVLLLGTGTVAVAAELNLSELVRRLFGDDTSAIMIEREQYQKVDLCVTDGERTVEALGVVGDEDTTLLLLEFSLADGVAKGEKVTGLHISCYAESEENGMHYGDWYSVEEYQDEDGMRRYLVSYEILWGWANDSKKNGEKLHVVVDGMSVTGGRFEEQHYFGDLELALTLDDIFSEGAKELVLNESVACGSVEVTIEAVRLSQYRTGFLIHYPAESAADAYEVFEMLTEEFIYQNGEKIENPDQLRLYHNGQEIAHSDRFVNYIPGNMDGTSGPGEYGCSLFLDAVDYVEGDTLEIHLGDEIIPLL